LTFEGVFFPASAAVAARLASECARQREEGVQYWPCFLRHAERTGGFGEHVGAVGLRRYFGDAPSCAGMSAVFEIGFHLRTDHWGKGLATEAAAAVLAFAFTELDVDGVFAGHNPQNTKSPRVLKKLGFVFTHEEYYAPTGLMHPSYILRNWPPEGTGGTAMGGNSAAPDVVGQRQRGVDDSANEGQQA
jgi:ribosomal-protein-alanine N-acetyltransferase